MASCIPRAEWNLTMESYVVHTNYDEYAIFLTKKFSRHHGPTITAKLYGKGRGLDKLAGIASRRKPEIQEWGKSRELCFILLRKLQLRERWRHLLSLKEPELSL